MGGLSDYGKSLALGAVLPNGTTRYVALLATVPTDEIGTGLVECTGSNYSRKGYSAWLSVTVETGLIARANNGAIEFNVLSNRLTVAGWAIYDAVSSGNLLAFGEMRDVDGNTTSLNILAGRTPRFLDQELLVELT